MRVETVSACKDGLGPGLHTVITSDLTELHAALASQEGASHAQ
ncbi:MAG TPA: hypothetical protein VN840_16180 [Streptosporangiaceae bacterium]|nr:hypothetical protein [Streptosporangiaceae bacterium]